MRFEIAYKKSHRKSHEKRHRPYLLGNLDSLNSIIYVFASGGLNRNQVYMLRDAVLIKRNEWMLLGETENIEYFNRFCRDLLVVTKWNKMCTNFSGARAFPWEYFGWDHKDFFDKWSNYMVWGWMEDAIQLYFQIMKGNMGKGGEDNG